MSPQIASDTVLSTVRLACPACRESLAISGDEAVCAACGSCYRREERVWDFLPASRETDYRPFIEAYHQIRETEGWASSDPDYYRRLPEVSPDDPQRAIWRMRQRSFDTFVSRVIEQLEVAYSRPLTVLDAGAGNCWLSNRLVRRGHQVVAVDLQTNRRHGLGACVHYKSSFLPVRAAYDQLPLAKETVDVVVFNASLHYAADLCSTVAESLRVLRTGGQLAVLDSPVYERSNSGAQMVRERQQMHKNRHGTPANGSVGKGYLTRGQLRRLAEEFSLKWTEMDPGLGLRRTLQRWTTCLLKGREAARMPVLVGHRASEDRLPLPSAHERHSRIVQKLGYLWRWLRAALFLKRRYNTFVVEEVRGYSLIVLSGVFNPALFSSSQWLVELMEEEVITVGQRVLDMGTGAGLAAVAAASRGSNVVAVDINPAAARSAWINALLNEVEQRIDVREGDLFDPVDGEYFDTVLFNPPFYEGVPDGELDQAWRGIDIADRFARELKGHLQSSGEVYLVLSSRGAPESFLQAFRKQDFEIEVVQTYDLISETQVVYRMYRSDETSC